MEEGASWAGSAAQRRCLPVFRLPQTGWLINNGDLSLTVLEPGSLRSGQQHGHVWADSQPAPSGWVLTRRKVRGSSLVSLL